MPIAIDDVVFSTRVVLAILLVVFLVSFRKTEHTDLFPISVTSELKGLGMLLIVFAHISYMLVTDNKFLYPLSIAAGVGVDLFLFMSGYGLTVGMLKRRMPVLEFYKRRLIKVFIPFWVVLAVLFITDAVFLQITYPASYLLQSFLGWFPRAIPYEDVNSPFWYISWMLMFYFLFPLLFNQKRPWITAILLAILANFLAVMDPLQLQAGWLHRLHTNAFSFGILLAWLLSETKDCKNPFVEKLKLFRNNPNALWRCVVIAIMTVCAGYFAFHSSAECWPRFVSILKALSIHEGDFIGQAGSLLTMFALIAAFSLKKLENKFFYIFGVYSYETYLLHWPLMARYDQFFKLLPAWLAVLVWLGGFLALGWLLQKVTSYLGKLVDGQRGTT